jgi:SAM-dependent methyltransferase
MDLGFRGEVADVYHRYRRGCPGAVLDALGSVFDLTGQDVVVGLGCGTGQLTLPMAARVRAVVGVDPEPGMLQVRATERWPPWE